jgi:hypothetical protein
VVVLWSFTAIGTLSATAHGLVCGDELSPVFIAGHGPDAHAVGAERPLERPTHCVLCHWMQSFRAGSVHAPKIVLGLRQVTSSPVVPTERTRTTIRLALSPRAPPA